MKCWPLVFILLIGCSKKPEQEIAEAYKTVQRSGNHEAYVRLQEAEMELAAQDAKMALMRTYYHARELYMQATYLAEHGDSTIEPQESYYQTDRIMVIVKRPDGGTENIPGAGIKAWDDWAAVVNSKGETVALISQYGTVVLIK